MRSLHTVSRLASIDAVRGLAVVLMLMHHALDAWTHPADRVGPLWRALRHLGGVPAPAFLLLAGLSAALVLGREREKGLPARARVAGAARRGLYVLGIAYACRVSLFLLDGNPWELLFRVDVLNCMGAALLLVGSACALAPGRPAAVAVALALAAAFLLPAPLLWGRNVPALGPFLGAYVGGTGPLVLFPLFPWVFFVAAGFALGELWGAIVARRPDPLDSGRALAWQLPAGLALVGAAWALDGTLPSLYPPYDWWKASPAFALLRTGVQLGLLGAAAWIWPRLGAAGERSLLVTFGRHSLLVYVVHLELAYGRPAWPIQQKLPIWAAGLLFALLTAAMALLARHVERREAFRRPATAAPATR